jgi:hypothetical protein
MCGASVDAAAMEGLCSSCPLYHFSNGCCIELIACPHCGYHSLPREHAGEMPSGPGVQPAGANGSALPVVAAGAQNPTDAGAVAEPVSFTPANVAGARPLSELPSGTRARLVGFNDLDDRQLGRLTAHGLLPGVVVEVIQRFPAVILGFYQSELALENAVARSIWVVPS